MSRRHSDKHLYDDSGKLIGVLLEPARYKALLAAMEELDDIKAYDDAVNSDDAVLDYEEVVSSILSNRPSK